jgi:hypothetical protein
MGPYIFLSIFLSNTISPWMTAFIVFVFRRLRPCDGLITRPGSLTVCL